MITVNFLSLFIIAVVALAAPMAAELVPHRLVPPVVLEVIAGVLVGPQVFHLVSDDIPVRVLSFMGLGFLLFLAGMELDAGRLNSPASRLGLLAFAISVAVSLPLGLLLKAAGANGDLRILALALTSTSLGILVPVLRDAGQADSEFGQTVLVAASVAEFTSLFLLTVLFSADPKSTPAQILYVAALFVSAVIAVFVVRWWWGAHWFRSALHRLDETTSQLRVRAAFVMLLLFVALVNGFGIDAVLGAFVAGVVLRVAVRGDPTTERFEAKLNAIGFGFLVPVFFIATGVNLDMRAVFHSPRTLALVPLIVAAMVICRGLATALVFRKRFSARATVALGAFQSTSLTFPIIAATVGAGLHFLGPGTAAAIVAAGLVSVIASPALALALRPWTERAAPAP